MTLADFMQVIRYVQPDPISAEVIGSQEEAELNKGQWMVVCNPWDKEAIKEAALRPFRGQEPPKRERAMKVMRGSMGEVVG